MTVDLGGVPRENVDVIININSKHKQTMIAVTTIDTTEINRFIFFPLSVSTAGIMGLLP